MADDFKGLIPHFYNEILSNWDTAIPRGAQWVIVFEDLNSVKDTIQDVIRNYEHREWDIDASINKIVENQAAIGPSKGCVFAQAVEIPGEGITTNTLGLQYNGYLRTTGGVGRDPYQGVRIAFLDTNVSFTELFVRPWVITTGHVGLIASPKHRFSTSGLPYTYRTNMTVYKLGTTNAEAQTPEILRVYKFYGVCPISVTNEEYNYSAPTGPVIHETTFLFNWYTVTGPNDRLLNYEYTTPPKSTALTLKEQEDENVIKRNRPAVPTSININSAPRFQPLPVSQDTTSPQETYGANYRPDKGPPPFPRFQPLPTPQAARAPTEPYGANYRPDKGPPPVLRINPLPKLFEIPEDNSPLGANYRPDKGPPGEIREQPLPIVKQV